MSYSDVSGPIENRRGEDSERRGEKKSHCLTKRKSTFHQRERRDFGTSGGVLPIPPLKTFFLSGEGFY